MCRAFSQLLKAGLFNTRTLKSLAVPPRIDANQHFPFSLYSIHFLSSLRCLWRSGTPGNPRLKAAVNWAGSGGTLRQGVSLMALYQSGKGAYEAE